MLYRNTEKYPLNLIFVGHATASVSSQVLVEMPRAEIADQESQTALLCGQSLALLPIRHLARGRSLHGAKPDYDLRLQFDNQSRRALEAKGVDMSGFANMLRPE